MYTQCNVIQQQQKEQSSAICKDTDETKGHYTRGNKPEIGDKYSIFLLIYASKSGKKVSVGNKAWKLK